MLQRPKNFIENRGEMLQRSDISKIFLRKGEKGGAAHAAPPILKGYSIARICSVNERFFKSRISHTERINCKRINISRYPPICIVGN
jgi:hypothetical protein